LKGILSFNYTFSKIYDSGFNPRVGLLYEFSDKFSIRGFYGEALRYPTAFYFGNFYLTDENKLDRILVGFNPSDKVLQGIFNSFFLVNPQNLLLPEETYSYELGGRWAPSSRFNFDASLFYSRTQNFISFEPLLEVDTPNDEHFIVNGYFNLGASETNLYGIQGQMQFKTSPVNPKFETTFGFSFTQGTEALPDTSQISESNARELGFVREQPDFIGQLQIGFLFTGFY
jgi:outer membrane receptor protein involved in Fe transport